MKKCKNCGKENSDISIFCSNCGSNEFEAAPVLEKASDQAPPQQQNVIPPQNMAPPRPQPQPPVTGAYSRGTPGAYQPQTFSFGVFDVLTILGFISSLLGLFYAWLVLEPLGVIASILGFFKGNKKRKGLAAAGFIIAVLAFLVKLIYSLYVNGVLGKWAIEGIFR